jgi:hypothetical protein
MKGELVMSIRYLSNLTLALLAGFEVVAFQAFSPSVFAWLALGGGVAAIVIGIASGATDHGRHQRVLSGPTVLGGAWIVVSSRVFAATTVAWLGFSAAAALALIAVVGLTLHELQDERVIHSVDMGSQHGAQSRLASASL